MSLPVRLQVALRGVSARPDVDAPCRAEFAKLARFHGRITSCRAGRPDTHPFGL